MNKIFSLTPYIIHTTYSNRVIHGFESVCLLHLICLIVGSKVSSARKFITQGDQQDPSKFLQLLQVSLTLRGLFRPFRSLLRTCHYILPDSSGHSATSPAPPRGGTTGHRAGQGGGDPRLRKSSARRLYHLLVTRTVLLEFTFLGPTGPTDQNFRARSDRYSIVPHPARCRNPASRPCTRTNKCCVVPTFLRLSLPFRTPIRTTEVLFLADPCGS
ncbi:hypothetical protein MTP99_005046 [Tenebrio molitor]|nr:hypothetical protein MTP99_005046 [Tenebrio molitor]